MELLFYVGIAFIAGTTEKIIKDIVKEKREEQKRENNEYIQTKTYSNNKKDTDKTLELYNRISPHDRKIVDELINSQI